MQTPFNASPSTTINRYLLESIQLCAVHSNLVIYLVCLVDDAADVLVLCINLLAHSLAKMVETLRYLVKRV